MKTSPSRPVTLLLAALCASLWSLPRAHALTYSLLLDGGYLYSRWEYQSPTSTFSLLSKAGTMGRGYLTVGGRSLDLIGGGGVENFKFTTPATRTLNKDTIATSMYLAGLRYKSPYLYATLTFQGKDALYLVENSTTSFDLKKAGVGFGVFGLTLFGWGAAYRITLDGEIGVPANKPKTDAGEMSVSYFTRGTCRVEFGGTFRIGIFTGIENMDYTVNDTTKLYRSDFFGGLTIAIGASKSSSGRSSSGGRGGSSSDGYQAPPWPL